MRSAGLILSGFVAAPIIATSDFFPLSAEDFTPIDDHAHDSRISNCPLRCLNNSTCISKATNGLAMVGESVKPGEYWYCECQPGFHGTFCEHIDDSCGDDYCRHGSKCIHIGGTKGPIEYMCDCTAAFTDDVYYAGRYCQFQSTIFCSPEDNPEGRQFCTNDGACGMFEHSPCQCPSGFSGPRCGARVEDDSPAFSECSLSCTNGGTCHKGEKKSVDTYGKFAVDISHLIQETHINFEHCICPRGSFGIKCEYEFEECGQSKQICLNGGTCEVSQQGINICTCIDGFHGDSCELENLPNEPSHGQASPTTLAMIVFGLCILFVASIAKAIYKGEGGLCDAVVYGTESEDALCGNEADTSRHKDTVMV